MPHPNESKEKPWCSALSNCFTRGTTSSTTWVSSKFTDAVIGLGCKVLDGEPDESCSSSPVEKGEDAVCTLQPKNQSEHVLIPLVAKEKPEKSKPNCSQEECPEAKSLTCSSSSSSLVHKIFPQLSCKKVVKEEENSKSLEVAIPANQEKASDKSEVATSESLEQPLSECSDIGSPSEKAENLCEPSVDFITPFVNQESEICPIIPVQCSENQEQPCEVALSVILQPDELSKVSTDTNQQAVNLLETAVLNLENQDELSLTATPQPEPILNTDSLAEEHLTLVSEVQHLDQYSVSHLERLSDPGVSKDLHGEESLTEKQQSELEVNADTQLRKSADLVDGPSVQFEKPVARIETEEANQNSVAIQSRSATQEKTTEISETKVLVGEPVESLSDCVFWNEEKPYCIEKSDQHSPSSTEKPLVASPSSSAAETNHLPNTHLAMESLTTGTEMLSISSLEDNLGSSREVSPSSDDLLETLAYVPDLDDTEDVDLEIDDLPNEDELKVLEISDNGELDSLESRVSPSVTANDNAPAATTVSNNNPSTTATVSSGETATTATTTTTTTSSNKKKNKKNATNNNATTTTTESLKADNKNNNANLSGKSEPKKAESKDPGPKSQKSNSKNKKKDDKSTDHILRALSSLSTPEEKLAALCKKYAELHEENRELGTSSKQNQRKLVVLTRQKEQLQLENNKAVMAKSQLESLCRELQKHNRIIKEESLARAKEEDEKRKEISAKFQSTINEIQTQMVDNHDRNMKLREENTELTTKLKNFLEQYEQREKYFEKIVKHRELEQQLADAKLKQASMQLIEEKERNTKEREFLLFKASETGSKMSLLEKQVKTYKDQYSDFQTTITKSNDMFGKLKGEMDKMISKNRKLDKENASWKNKWENCNKALLGMIDQKTTMDKERILLQTKIQKLESLCRAQQERLRAQKSPPPAEECPKCCFAETSSTPSSTDNTSAESAQVPVTNSSSKTDEAADHSIPAESCVTPDSVTPATGSTVPATDSLPNLQPTEIPSTTVSECSAASSTSNCKTDEVGDDKTTDETSVQSCHSNSSVGDSNCSSTNNENPSSEKQVLLVDHTAPVKSCTQST